MEKIFNSLVQDCSLSERDLLEAIFNGISDGFKKAGVSQEDISDETKIKIFDVAAEVAKQRLASLKKT